MNDNKLGIALTKKLCPVCLKKMDGEIIMNTKLTKGNADKVNELHGKVTHISKDMCNACKEAINDGVYIIGVDLSKTEDENNPYRSGHIVGVKRTIFKEYPGPIIYMDYNEMKQLQLV